MKIICSLDEITDIQDTGVALGNFDGVHIGHQKLIKSAVDFCQANHLLSAVFTFRNHPKNLNGNSVKQIMTWEEKVEVMEEMGVDYLIAVEFNEEIMTIKPEDFLKDILLDKLRAKEIFCGFHYHFGHKAQGDTELLDRMKEKYGYGLFVLGAVTYDDEVVSSTRIRELIEEGEMERCNKLLSRNYSVKGEVIPGKQLGKQIGFPTANVIVKDYLAIPKNGVYISKTTVDNKVYKSVTNIGYNPTVGGQKRMVETFIMGLHEDIYGKEIKVEILKRIRPEIKFNNITELTNQIAADVKVAQEYSYDF
ncbi:MAG: bifunctional riboflavin kinase/FAD synthetase [Peptostreptococcales bacterium]